MNRNLPNLKIEALAWTIHAHDHAVNPTEGVTLPGSSPTEYIYVDDNKLQVLAEGGAPNPLTVVAVEEDGEVIVEQEERVEVAAHAVMQWLAEVDDE